MINLSFSLARSTKKLSFYLIALVSILFLAEIVTLVGGEIWKPVYRAITRDSEYFTIYVIGGSTSVGQPFDPILSYPKMISRCFNDSILGKPIKIINLARSGMALEYNFWELHHELLLRPQSGCLLIYSGINENIDNKADPLSFLWGLTQHSFLVSKTLYLLGSTNSLYKYKQCLKQTIELAQSYDLTVIVSELVGNFGAFDPDVTSDEESKLNSLPSNLLKWAYSEENDSNWDCALELYTSIDHYLPEKIPYINYKIGKCLLNLGKTKEAIGFLTQAIDSGISIRPASWKNDAIRDMAKSTRAYLIEPLPVFNKLSPLGVTDYHLFMDAHHPNIQGYLMLANEFRKALSVIYDMPGSKEDCSLNQILESFDIQDKYLCGCYLRSALWHINMTTTTYEPDERIISASNFLKKAALADPNNPEVVVYGAVTALLKKDLKAFRQIMDDDSIWSNRDLVSASLSKLWAGKPREIPINTLNFWYKEGRINCQEFNKFISMLNIADAQKNCIN